jgi:hypothetical protein
VLIDRLDRRKRMFFADLGAGPMTALLLGLLSPHMAALDRTTARDEVEGSSIERPQLFWGQVEL